MNKKEIGAVFEARRKELKLTHLDIVDEIGVDAHAITKLSRGEVNYNVDTMLRLLDVVGLELAVVRKS